MTRVLSVDTTGSFGSVALLEEDRVVEELVLHSPEGFGHILFDAIRRLLARHNWPMESVGVFAAAAGPGSFTGVRVGLAAMKGLAEASGAAAVAVSNLAALAACGSLPLRAAVIDARRGEIYGGLYDAAGNAIQDEVVTAFPRWLDGLPDPPDAVEFVSNGFQPFAAALAASRFADARVTEQRSLAGATGRLAWRRLAAGALTDAAALDANYVRRSDAELLWKDVR